MKLFRLFIIIIRPEAHQPHKPSQKPQHHCSAAQKNNPYLFLMKGSVFFHKNAPQRSSQKYMISLCGVCFYLSFNPVRLLRLSDRHFPYHFPQWDLPDFPAVPALPGWKLHLPLLLRFLKPEAFLRKSFPSFLI